MSVKYRVTVQRSHRMSLVLFQLSFSVHYWFYIALTTIWLSEIHFFELSLILARKRYLKLQLKKMYYGDEVIVVIGPEGLHLNSALKALKKLSS